MVNQLVAEKNIPRTCAVCNSPVQKVMEQCTAKLQTIYYECLNCGSLHRKCAGVAKSIEYIPKDSLLCRDTFLSFTVVKKITEIYSDSGICVISSNGNSGFLNRMLVESGFEVTALRYIEKNNYLGVELNEHSYRAISEEDHLEGKLFVVFATLSMLENPQALFDLLANLKPKCMVTIIDVYQGQNLTWSVLQNQREQNQIYFSHRALSLVADKIQFTLYSAESVHVFTFEKLNDRENYFVRLLSSLQSMENGDFSEYLISVKRKHQAMESLEKSNVISNARNYLAAPVGDKLYVDCIFFQMANSGIARVWNEVFRIWSKKYSDKVILLDRGGNIQDCGLQRIPFKRFDFSSIFSEIRALSWFLLRKGAHRFVSTYYTYSEIHPTKAVVYDMIPENLSFDKNDPQWVLKKLYLDHSESAFGISGQTISDVVRYFPHLEGKVNYAYPGISQTFKPINNHTRQEFRKRFGVTSRYLFTVPCAIGGYKDGMTALRAIDRLGISKESEVICTVPLIGQEKLIETLSNIKVRAFRFSDEDYAELIASSDLVIWPPWMEGLGLPPIEAVACHTNVVVSRTSINVELFGDTVIYAEPGNVESFSAAIEDALAKGIGSQLIERIDAHRSVENFADKLFNFLYL